MDREWLKMTSGLPLLLFVILRVFMMVIFFTLNSQVFGTLWPVRDLLLICY